MACSLKYSHAYIQYVRDKEKEIVTVSQFVNCVIQTITRGKIVQVHWLNEQTGKQELYDAYIHFLGDSEENVIAQVSEAMDGGILLKLPSQKILSSLEDDIKKEVEFEKSKKMKVEAAKDVIRKEILEKKKESLLRESRKKLSLHENSSSDKENEPQITSNIVFKETEEDTLTPNEGVDSKNEEDKDQKLSGENVGEGTSSKEKTDSVELKKHDILNDKTYLGGGIFLETQEWKSIKHISSHGPFIIALATSIWGDDLKNHCINKKKAGPREEGQIRKKISTKKLKALEDVFCEKLVEQGFKGRRRLAELVKKVRTTLTHKINDLNKKPRKKKDTSDLDSDDN